MLIEFTIYIYCLIRFKIYKILRKETTILSYFKIRIEEYLPPPSLKLKKTKNAKSFLFCVAHVIAGMRKIDPKGGLIAERHRVYAD